MAAPDRGLPGAVAQDLAVKVGLAGELVNKCCRGRLGEPGALTPAVGQPPPRASDGV
ncbi:hypothetical protein GCM10009790_25740 [Georgenia ruanii]